MTMEEEFNDLTRYVAALGKRSRRLGDDFGTLENDLGVLAEKISLRKKHLVSEIGDLRTGLSSCKEQTRELQKALLSTIQDIKASIRKDDLKRMESRVDRWGPEKLLTRHEVTNYISR